MVQLHPAQDQAPARHQPVDVVAVADAQLHGPAVHRGNRFDLNRLLVEPPGLGLGQSIHQGLNYTIASPRPKGIASHSLVLMNGPIVELANGDRPK
jgi:hypothetical protein